MRLASRAAPLRALLFLAVLSIASPAALAQQFDVAVGGSKTTFGEVSPVVAASWLPVLSEREKGTLRWEIGAVHVRGRDFRAERDLVEDVTVGFVGLRYERHDNGLTLGGGVGAQDGETDALSGDPQFVTTLGWRWSEFSLLLRHVSNASQHGRNDGETMLLGAWRF